MRALAFLIFIAVSISTASAQSFVVIVRHAEKASNSDKDPDLSSAGVTRAEALAGMLKDSGIAAIFTTELKRTQETAAPLAKALSIAPTIVPAKDIEALSAKLREQKGNALVVGHGNTIPDVIKALGIETSINIPESDYTSFFVVTLGDKPQLLRLHY